MSKQLASASKLCVEMFDEEDDDQELPMVEATGAQLARVVEWLKFHETNPIKAIEKPLKHDNLVELLGEWDAAFIELDGKSGLFQLTNASHFMQIPTLYEFCCVKLACMIKGKTAQELKSVFYPIPDDYEYTKKEQDALDAECPWLAEAELPYAEKMKLKKQREEEAAAKAAEGEEGEETKAE